MKKHTKAFRCRIDNTARIYRLKENWHIPINMSKSLEEAISRILEDYPNENIVIKSDKGGGLIIAQGQKNKPFVIDMNRGTKKGSTKWLRLIKSDGTVWTIINERYVGEKVR